MGEAHGTLGMMVEGERHGGGSWDPGHDGGGGAAWGRLMVPLLA